MRGWRVVVKMDGKKRGVKFVKEERLVYPGLLEEQARCCVQVCVIALKRRDEGRRFTGRDFRGNLKAKRQARGGS